MEFPSITLGDSKNDVLVFLAGFPDDHFSSLGPLLDEFKKTHFVISLCHPGFENTEEKRRLWGYDFEELLPMMQRTVARLAGDRKVTLIIHDWGSFTGLLFANKYAEMVTRVVTIDVGLTAKLPPPSDLFYITYYQWHFACFYVVSQIINVTLGQLMFKLFYAWMKLCPFLSPVPYDVNRPSHRPSNEVSVEMCYPYFWFWLHFFQGTKVAPVFPTCPVLFMYGKKKNVMFHSPRFLERLDQTPGCRQIGFDCGHWVQHDETAAVLSEIKNFLKKTDSAFN